MFVRFKRSFFLGSICTFFFFTSSLIAAPFTFCSYNCGALSDHYDYIRAVCMHKLMQERYNEEPDLMHQFETLQALALKVFYERDPLAQKEWEQKGYDVLFQRLTAHPEVEASPNKQWHDRLDTIVTSYRERPVLIYDEQVRTLLEQHLQDLSRSPGETISNRSLQVVRDEMAKRIFTHELKYDVIALQEADYLEPSFFPSYYQILFSPSKHSVNGLAWNTNRFELLHQIGEIPGRGFALLLRELESGQSVLFISAHLTGCDPFSVVDLDSKRGDRELEQILEFAQKTKADIKVIGMDSNVTACHPRLQLLKEAGFVLDSAKYLEPTCASPWQILNTRIDWITVHSAEVSNLPVTGVGLNSPQTNISDHKPIAACINTSK